MLKVNSTFNIAYPSYHSLSSHNEITCRLEKHISRQKVRKDAASLWISLKTCAFLSTTKHLCIIYLAQQMVSHLDINVLAFHHTYHFRNRSNDVHVKLLLLKHLFPF